MTRSAVLALVFLLASVEASSQFEGTVESVNTTVDEVGVPQKFTMTIWLKGTWVRVGTSGTQTLPGTTFIARPDLGVRWVIDDSTKTYFEVEQATQPGPNQGQARAQSSGVKKTGKTKRILGYACEQYHIVHDEVTTELWGTKGLAGLQSALHTAFGGDEEAGGSWAADIEALGVYPMAASTRVDGVVMESHEVVKIEQRSLPANLFSLPEGYRKYSLDDTLK